ncbi:MAG TPA: 4-alpha-glucanotransferase [Chitinophaga sp.]
METGPAHTVRSAGILMHITSLPGPFGIGDIGPAAREFADKLQSSGQRYWQLLPLTPPGAGLTSPYSAMSAMAGNPMLISPELLVEDGLLSQADLREVMLPSTDTVDFSKARDIKLKLLELAYHNYCNRSEKIFKKEYQAFCEQQAYWLDDFTSFKALSVWHKHEPWIKWRKQYRDREQPAPRSIKAVKEKQQWCQFIFNRQWMALKAHCNRQGIQLFGDLPFYVAYDAADVWANREIFRLDDKGRMLGVAGVPPDYFNENGQLWNMPVYNWKALRTQRYKWWINRLRRNLEWYDLLRLDHFRAFSAYWEVAAGEDTAKNGAWKPGAGASFMKAVQKAFPSMPFVAEDLGEIDDPVLQLRDEFRLPGMKVLQFAFGEDMPVSPHIPHNHTAHFFVYTGTHDNNTSRGWYSNDIGDDDHQRLAKYTGMKVTEEAAPDVLGRMAYASVARTAILPMQDVLRLDGKARMNTPAVADGNWAWRMLPEQFSEGCISRLKKWTIIYNRTAKDDHKKL